MCCAPVYGGNVSVCDSVSQIPGGTGGDSHLFLPVRAGNAVLYVYDPDEPHGDLSGVADPDQFLGL